MKIRAGSRRGVLAAGLAIALLAGACGSSSKSSAPGTSSATTTAAPVARPHVTFEAHEYGFTGPSTVPAGYVDVTLHNIGHMPHQLGIARVTDTATIADVQTAVAATNPYTKQVTQYVGGPNNVAPGKSATVTMYLAPGRYGMMCYLPAPDGKAHSLHGMVKFFTVTGAPNPAPKPQPVATATLHDFNFALPEQLPRAGTLEVDNQGTQVHEMIIDRLLPGKTLDDARSFYLAYAQGKHVPLPFEEIGSVMGISPGQKNWLDLHLQPGSYAFFCFYPDPNKTGLPHALEGMLTIATVA